VQQTIYEFYESAPLDIKYIHRAAYNYPMHYHESTELIYCVSGSVQYEIGGEIYTVNAGEAAFVFPFLHHRVTAVGEDIPECYVLMIHRRVLIDLPFSCHATIPVSPVLPMDAELPLIEEILDLWEEQDLELLPHYLKILVIRLTRRMELRRRVQSASPETDIYVSELLHYISEHYREPLTLTDTATAIGINPFRASRLLNDVAQSSFSDIINNYRLIDAEHLLRSTDMRVAEIADDCGFGSVSSFQRLFRERYRMSPGAYRLQASSKIDSTDSDDLYSIKETNRMAGTKDLTES